MNFQEFTIQISRLKEIPLPGESAHLEMAPLQRILELKRMAVSQDSAKKAGAMALFYPGREYDTKMALILRKTSRDVHSGQVGFPGGKIEPGDRSFLDTALRETEEEIGIQRSKIDVIRNLTEIYIPPSNFLVYPFMGLLNEFPKFVLQPSEVEDLIEVNLSEFLDEKAIITKKVNTSYGINIETPAFYLNDHVVWGATAMMLSEIRILLKNMG